MALYYSERLKSVQYMREKNKNRSDEYAKRMTKNQKRYYYIIVIYYVILLR